MVCTAMATAACGPDDVWTTDVGRVTAGPIAVDGSLVVATEDGTLRALDPDDGAERWSVDLPVRGDDDLPDEATTRWYADGGPLDLPVEVVDLGDGGVATLTVRGGVCVHEVDGGAQRWCAAPAADDDPVADPTFRPHLAAGDGRLLAVTRDARVLDLDPADGAASPVADVSPAGPRLPWVPWIAFADDLALLVGVDPGDGDGVGLVALDGDGARWVRPGRPWNAEQRVAATAVDGELIVAAPTLLLRLDAEAGEPRWLFDPASVRDLEAGLVGVTGVTPVLVDDLVVFATHVHLDGDEVRVVAVDAESGELVWSSDPVTAAPGPGADQVALAVTDRGDLAVLGRDLHVFAPDGEHRGEHGLGLDHPSRLWLDGGDAVVAAGDRVVRVSLPSDG